MKLQTAVYLRSLTQRSKPTAAQILQIRLRKSIDARDALRCSPQPRGAKNFWKDEVKVTDIYCCISVRFTVIKPTLRFSSD